MSDKELKELLEIAFRDGRLESKTDPKEYADDVVNSLPERPTKDTILKLVDNLNIEELELLLNYAHLVSDFRRKERAYNIALNTVKQVRKEAKDEI